MGSMAALFGALGFVNDCVTPVLFVMKPLMLLFLTVVIWFGIKLNQIEYPLDIFLSIFFCYCTP